MKKIIRFFMTVNIFIAMAIPIITSFIYVLILFSILHNLYGNNIPEFYSGIGLGVGLLIFGLCGIIEIVRRESPGLAFNKPFKGSWALFNGIMITLIFEGSGLVLLVIALIGK